MSKRPSKQNIARKIAIFMNPGKRYYCQEHNFTHICDGMCPTLPAPGKKLICRYSRTERGYVMKDAGFDTQTSKIAQRQMASEKIKEHVRISFNKYVLSMTARQESAQRFIRNCSVQCITDIFIITAGIQRILTIQEQGEGDVLATNIVTLLNHPELHRQNPQAQQIDHLVYYLLCVSSDLDSNPADVSWSVPPSEFTALLFPSLESSSSLQKKAYQSGFKQFKIECKRADPEKTRIQISLQQRKEAEKLAPPRFLIPAEHAQSLDEKAQGFSKRIQERSDRQWVEDGPAPELTRKQTNNPTWLTKFMNCTNLLKQGGYIHSAEDVLEYRRQMKKQKKSKEKKSKKPLVPML